MQKEEEEIEKMNGEALIASAIYGLCFVWFVVLVVVGRRK